MDRHNLSIFSPASPPAESIRNLSVLVFAITGFIFLVVEGVLIYCIVRFRRRAVGDTTEPPQVYGSKPIEIAWTAAPALIVFILMLVTTRTLWEVNVDSAQAARRAISRSSSRWSAANGGGNITYENYDGKKLGFTTANELHIPASETGVARPVYLTLKSADVCHSFWVPRLAGKTDLIPGRTNSMWFQTEQTGLFLGQCAEYCGTQHANMLIRVVVDSPRDFERWLDHEASPAVDDPPRARARRRSWRSRASTATGCAERRRTGTYAPDLTHLMSRDTLASGMIAEHARRTAALGRRPAEGQAGLPDAGVRPERPRPRPDRRLSDDAPLRDAIRRGLEWLSPSENVELASPPWTAVLHDWVTTVDHKKIGILYVLMSLVFLVDRRRRSPADALAAPRPAQRRSSGRTRSTSCSRCTAPRWSSSWACRS